MKRLLFLALAGAALLTSIHPALSQAPNARKVRLILRSRPIDQTDRADQRANVLRPNIEQEVLTYVQNDEAQAQTIKVQLLADNVEVAASKPHSVDPGKLVQIQWPRVAETPSTKPTDLTRPVVLRLVDAAGDPLGEDRRLTVERPDNYLDASVEFVPRSGSETNRLIATVTPKATFKGPPCRVQLDLDPARIPVLDPGQKKKGVYAGSVRGEKDSEGNFRSVHLAAEDVRLNEASNRSGVVTIQADGYNRAFAFLTDFPSSGRSSKPDRRGDQTLRLKLDEFADPYNRVPVVIEADNLVEPEDARLLLEVATPVPGKKEAEEQFNVLAEFRGERDVQLFYRGGGRNGGLRFVPEVRDWSKKLDFGGLYGSVTLRLRLLDKAGAAKEVLDGERGVKVKEVRKTILLDDTPPEGVRLTLVSRAVVRGKPFVVEARGSDPESGIRDVIFFLGRLPAADKLPTNAITVPGKRVNKEGGSFWTADLVARSDAPNPLDVSVQFINKVGLSTNQTITVEAIEPTPLPGAKVEVKRGSIAGVVMEGDRPQKGLKVDLLDPSNKILLSVNSATDGTFIFKDLLPGPYRVASVKRSSNTRGVTRDPIPLAAGEAKTGIVIKLWRR